MLMLCLLILTHGLYASDVQPIARSAHSLVTQCLAALAKLPFDHFEDWQNKAPVTTKQQYINYYVFQMPELLQVAPHEHDCFGKRTSGAIASESSLVLENEHTVVSLKAQAIKTAAMAFEQNDDKQYTSAYLDQDRLIVGTHDGFIEIFKVTGKALKLIHSNRISQDAITGIYTAGDMIACSHPHNSKSVLQILPEEISLIKRFSALHDQHGQWRLITDMAVSPDGNWLAYVHDRTYIYVKPIREDGNGYSLKYDNSTVGSLLFISPTSIIANLIHGNFQLKKLLLWDFLKTQVRIYDSFKQNPLIVCDQRNWNVTSLNDEQVHSVSAQIMFKLRLASITNEDDLQTFERCMEKLRCRTEPLWKFKSIRAKRAELQETKTT